MSKKKSRRELQEENLVSLLPFLMDHYIAYEQINYAPEAADLDEWYVNTRKKHKGPLQKSEAGQRRIPIASDAEASDVELGLAVATRYNSKRHARDLKPMRRSEFERGILRNFHDDPVESVQLELSVLKELMESPPPWAKEQPELYRKIMADAKERFPKRFIPLAVNLVRYALTKNQKAVNDFLEGVLKFKPSEQDHQRAALWKVLRQKGWTRIDVENLLAYIKVAVRNESNRLKRDSEIENEGKWRELKQKPLHSSDPHEGTGSQEVVLGDTVSPRRGQRYYTPPRSIDDPVKLKIINELHRKSPPRQQKLIDLLLHGATVKEALQGSKLPRSTYQSFQRKAERELAKHKKNKS